MNSGKSNQGVFATVGGVVLLVLVLVGAMMGSMMGPGMMWGYARGAPFVADGWLGPFLMGSGWLMMLAFWAAIGVSLVLVVRAVAERSGQPQDAPDAREILRRRYAAGEIDEATYDHQCEKLVA